MEITVKKVLLLSAAIAVFGAAAQLQPRARSNWRTEEWVKSALPVKVGDYKMEPSREDPTVSYTSPKSSYDILHPFGIVGRVFGNGTTRIDCSAVVGNNRDCFHDPNYCMVGQNWNILTEKIATIQTKTRGSVPVSVMSGEDSDGKRIVAFCYLGPRGFHATQNSLYSDWFWNEILQGKPIMGAFYRFMTMSDKDSEDGLLQFVADYLDESKITSKGEL